jgi:hypothetical protein
MAKKPSKSATADTGKPAFKKSIGTLAIMGVSIAQFAKEFEPGQVPLYSIAGSITRMRATRSKFGEGVGFKGVFLIKRDDGVLFECREFFAPPDLQDELQTAWAQRADNVHTLDFQANVSIVIDPEAKPLGYTYLSEPVGNIGGTTQMSALADKLGVKLLALDAPKS